MKRVHRRNADLLQHDDGASIQSAPTVKLISPDAVIEFARLLARAAARDLLRGSSDLPPPIDVPRQPGDHRQICGQEQRQEGRVPLAPTVEASARAKRLPSSKGNRS